MASTSQYSSGEHLLLQEEIAVLFQACVLGRADIVKHSIASMQSKVSSLTSQEVSDLISNGRKEDGFTPLHIAAQCGHADVIRSLLSAGANISMVASSGEFKGKSPYQIASESVQKVVHVFLFEQIAMGNMTSVKQLLLSGVPCDLRDGFPANDTTLHWAVSFNNIDVTRLLLENGCDCNAQNNVGQTSLHFACKNSNAIIVELLLLHGADISMQDANGRIPLDLCPAASREMMSRVLHKPLHALSQDSRDVGDVATSSSAAISIGASDSIGDTSNSELKGRDEGSGAMTVDSIEQANDPMLVFWPPVQRQESSGYGPLIISSAEPVVFSVPASSADIIDIISTSGLLDILESVGLQSQIKRSARNAVFRVAINPSLCPGINRYHICVMYKIMTITASDTAGLLYALRTVSQLIQLHSTIMVDETTDDYVVQVTVPAVRLQDWPDFLQRGVLMSLRSNAQLSLAGFTSFVQVFSRLRLNTIVLLLDTFSDESESEISLGDNALPIRSDEFGNPIRDSASEPSTIDDIHAEGIAVLIGALQDCGHRHGINVVPSIVVSSPNSFVRKSILKAFIGNELLVDFNFDPKADGRNQLPEVTNLGSYVDHCKRCCEQVYAAAIECGIDSISLACDNWTRRHVAPLHLLASAVGLCAIERSAGSVFHSELYCKSIASAGTFVRNLNTAAEAVRRQGDALFALPAFLDADFCYPSLLLKYLSVLHAGIAWNRSSSVDILDNGYNISGDIVTSSRKDLTAANFCDCSILRDVVSILLFNRRADHVNNESNCLLGMLTGELWNTSFDSGALGEVSASSNSLDAATHGQPAAPISVLPQAIVDVEQLLWSIIMANTDMFYTALAPSRVATAFCLRYYRRILTAVKWKVKSTVADHDSSPLSFVGFSFSKPVKPISVSDIDPEVEELFAIIHLLSVVCRMILLGYIAIAKRDKANRQKPTPEDQVAFYQLVDALHPGTKSDIANLLLEAIDHCNRLFRRRFEHLHLSIPTEDNSTLTVQDKSSGSNLVNVQSKYHPVVEEFSGLYINRNNPVFPTMLLFDNISRQLPMPPTVAETLATIFSNSRTGW